MTGWSSNYWLRTMQVFLKKERYKNQFDSFPFRVIHIKKYCWCLSNGFLFVTRKYLLKIAVCRCFLMTEQLYIVLFNNAFKHRFGEDYISLWSEMKTALLLGIPLIILLSGCDSSTCCTSDVHHLRRMEVNVHINWAQTTKLPLNCSKQPA